MGTRTEVTDLDNIIKQVGEVQASPTANTVLDRLKTIATNTGSGSNNFTALNSTNVNASKVDLDNALLAFGDPVNSPAVYSMNWRMWQVAVTVQSMGQNWFSTTNSSNVDLMKTDLDNIATSTALFTAANSTNINATKVNLDNMITQLGNINTNINYANTPFFNIQSYILRPANITAYTANQQINTSTTVNNTISFDLSGLSNSANKNIQIDEITIINNGTSGTLATLNLYISETSTGNWNGKDATTPVFTGLNTIGTMEVISPGILVKIPGDASNWNSVKATTNCKMWLDANSKCYLCFTSSTAYTPVSNETFAFRIRGRLL